MATVGSKDEPATTTQGVAGHADSADGRDAAVTLNVAGPGVAASIIRLTNAISMRLEEEVKTSSASGSRAEAAAFKQRYDYLSAQVSRAEGQIHSRMTWLLHFNGLLFVALAFLKSSPAGDGRNVEVMVPWLVHFLLGALPLAGLGITLSGWLGIRGAISQLKYLGRQYAQDVQRFAHENRWPAPFGDSRALWYGTAPVQLLLAALCLLWAWLLAHRIWPDATEAYSTLFLHALSAFPARVFGGA
ncbi:hypothetical protein WKW79_08360 [Variovorax robiniae]|uniref:DUF2868 domain-containing protein n=1 Tax=Variovorax robiniae TaxID=1836199 RepID=A0ABU8X456_9BURK